MSDDEENTEVIANGRSVGRYSEKKAESLSGKYRSKMSPGTPIGYVSWHSGNKIKHDDDSVVHETGD